MRIFILAMLALSFAHAADDSSPWGVDVLAFGVSRHSDHESSLQERNPGIGLGVTYLAGEPSNDWRADWVAEVGSYRDSWDDRARFALGGMRWTYANRASAELLTGYYVGSGKTGAAVVPSISVRMAGPVWICATGDPRHGDIPDDDRHRIAFVGLFLRAHWEL